MSLPDWKPTVESLAVLFDRYEEIDRSEIVMELWVALNDAYSKGQESCEPDLTERLKAAAKKKLEQP